MSPARALVVVVVAAQPGSAAAQEVRLGTLPVAAAGLTAPQAQAALTAIGRAVRQAGALWLADELVPNDCWGQAACIAAAARRLDLTAVLATTLLRVGPAVQISLRLYDAGGAEVLAEEWLAAMADFPGEAFVEVVRRCVARASPTATADTAPPALATLPASPARPSAVSPAPAPASPPSPGGAARWPRWLTLTGALVVTAAGGALLAAGGLDAARVEAAPDGAMWRDYQDAAARAPTLRTAGGVALGAGGAGVVAALVWLLLD